MAAGERLDKAMHEARRQYQISHVFPEIDAGERELALLEAVRGLVVAVDEYRITPPDER